ncbi:MAG: MFS transporter [Actinomycetota bacterium]|nr:MFS transporter [Actinomycetota bacterium]
MGTTATATKGSQEEGRYRWVVLFVLAAITNVGYGTIFYSFSILLGEDAAAVEFSRTLLSSALGLGVVVSGALAPIVGTLCDISGSRRVFFAGAVLGSAGLAAFSRATEGWQVLVAWALLVGPAMACTFYEPAYVTIDQWFAGRSTGTAIGVLTLVGGLSATIFIPLTQSLVENTGWRDAMLILAAVLLAVVGALALVFLKDRPREEARQEDLDLKGTYGALATGLRHTNRAFWLVSASYFLGFVAVFAVLFHQVAYLQELGIPAGTAALAAGLVGLAGLPGRLFFPMLGDRVRPSFLIAVIFLMVAISVLFLPGAEERWQLYLYVGLFGLSFGAVLPMRAIIMGHHFGGPLYGRLMGLQFALLGLATAGGPFAAGVLRDASGSYALLTPAVIVMLLLAIPAILIAEHEGRTGAT